MVASKKRALIEESKLSDKEVQLTPSRKSDEPPLKKSKWVNRDRLLVFASRGISYQARHLMEDLRALMPHAKKESKMEKKESLYVINEICDLQNCNRCLFFEGHRFRDLYMWMAKTPQGPSVKFLVENAHTMDELRFSGNCLKGSRPILSFSEGFESSYYLTLIKEMFTQVFSTPHHHPKSQPFLDHVLTFTLLDNRIWIRHYQIMGEDGAVTEIGPRVTLNPIKIFRGSFSGDTLWQNANYITPAVIRRKAKLSGAGRYMDRVTQKLRKQNEGPLDSYDLDPTDDVFHGELSEKNSLEKIREFHSKPTRRTGKKNRQKKNIAM